MRGGDWYAVSSWSSSFRSSSSLRRSSSYAASNGSDAYRVQDVIMLCRKPFVQGKAVYPCGQCLPCRVNRRRLWTHRLMLEQQLARGSAFVTLTYSEERLPVGMSLMPGDLRNWLKRFRKMIEPERVRYYAVGEYGDQSERPHYHVALFGFGPCLYRRSRYSTDHVDCCAVCDAIRDSWGHGFIYVGELEARSCAYIAGYMLKKMTSRDDSRLKGRHPEFARMSLRPGIGGYYMDEVASALLDYNLEQMADVPNNLLHGVKAMPLGRYLVRRLRERIGRDAGAPAEVLEAIAQELSPLFRSEERYSALFGETFKREWINAEDVVRANDQKVRNMESRLAIFKGRKVL